MVCLFFDVFLEVDVCCVCFDYCDGCGVCVCYLWELGYCEFGLLVGLESLVFVCLCFVSWCEVLYCLNIVCFIMVFGDWSVVSGWQKIFEFFYLQLWISVIVVVNDQMVFGVFSVLVQFNCSGSQVVLVIGYDDIVDSFYFQLLFIMVVQDFDLLGKRVVEWLIVLMVVLQLWICELLLIWFIVCQLVWFVVVVEDWQQILVQLKVLVEKFQLLVVEVLLKLSMLILVVNVER